MEGRRILSNLFITRIYLWAQVALFTCLFFAGSLQTQSYLQEKPNVVLILTDDLGWADVGSYGALDIKTPSLDGLSREGVRFTDFYSNGVLCSPTRAGLISGRYQQRYGIERAFSSANYTGDAGLVATGSQPMFRLSRIITILTLQLAH